ncbi:S8 family peptidase [Tumebacillus sp. DT12]|uniref:S8 family peptidase n=1 Tax=Tumebacillus lacus TaxID=2995335 RepID=A0ABT3X2X0_9BACL|nr:S8 family peptidase [Tumebacillus lacus]MCX7571248.1 S8 family peptidase [Tumebacillus lacus]
MKKTMISLMTAAALLTALAPSHVQAAQDVQAVKADKHAVDRVLVKLKQGKQASTVLEKHGLKEFRTLGKSQWKLVKVPNGKAADFLANLQGDADVEVAELDQVYSMTPEEISSVQGVIAPELTPNDPGYPSQWYLNNIQVPYAWDITTGSTSLTLGVISTGVDIQHPDLASKIVGGYDFVNNDTVADDDQGQGTAMAGLAAAIGNNGIGIAGVDWKVRVLPVKVLSANGSGYVSDIIDGVYYAADNSNVMVMGLGGGSYSTAFQDAINYAWNKNRVIVAAVGSSNTSTPSYPANYSNVFSVAATTSSNTKASFSDYGTWVDIAAPGSSLLTLSHTGGTTTLSGASMAAALVSGVTTLAWSKNIGYSNSSVVNRLCSTADAISGTGTYWRCGKVNAYRAVNGF